MTSDGGQAQPLGCCGAALARLTRVVRLRDVAAGAVLLTVFSLLACREATLWMRDMQARRDALLLFADAPREQSARAAARLCLSGLGVARDTLGAAAWAELPPASPPTAHLLNAEGEELLPGLTRGQFRRLPRIGARGSAGALHFNMFRLSNFSKGDFAMTRSRYALRIPGTPLLLPRPMRECAAATPAAVAALPAACDVAAAKAGRAQGYTSIGSIEQNFLAALPDRDVLHLGPKWPTCALVGAHAGRGAPGAGRAIDAATAVIRIVPPPPAPGRTPPPPPPPELAGRRTSVRVLGPAASAAASASGTDRDTEGLHTIHHTTTLRIITDSAGLNASLRWQHANPFADVVIADADFHQLALDSHGGRTPPAAFYALLLAAERCESVALFGFTCDRDEEAATEGDYADGISAAEAAAAVHAEERAWRVFLSRRGAQFGFAAEARDAPRARKHGPANPSS